MQKKLLLVMPGKICNMAGDIDIILCLTITATLLSIKGKITIYMRDFTYEKNVKEFIQFEQHFLKTVFLVRQKKL